MIEIEQSISDKDYVIPAAMLFLDVVARKQYSYRKKVVELTEAVRQAKYNLTKLKVERQILEREFWKKGSMNDE